MNDPQKYLYFTDYDKGKVVGTHTGCNKGNGFSGEEVKDVFIPETFENVKATEVGYCSFYGTSIESVFISRYVKLINSFAFCFCGSLEYITFDPRSELTKLGLQSLLSSKIASINLPASFKEIGGSNDNSSPFYAHSYLKCVSYMDLTTYYFLIYFTKCQIPLLFIHHLITNIQLEMLIHKKMT